MTTPTTAPPDGWVQDNVFRYHREDAPNLVLVWWGMPRPSGWGLTDVGGAGTLGKYDYDAPAARNVPSPPFEWAEGKLHAAGYLDTLPNPLPAPVPLPAKDPAMTTATPPAEAAAAEAPPTTPDPELPPGGIFARDGNPGSHYRTTKGKRVLFHEARATAASIEPEVTGHAIDVPLTYILLPDTGDAAPAVDPVEAAVAAASKKGGAKKSTAKKKTSSKKPEPPAAPAPTFTFVEQVRGTVKGGVDVKLGKRTLLVGDNAVGKSAVVNTVELALMGQATDIQGRGRVKQPQSLLELVAPHVPEVEAAVVLNDGTEVTWKIRNKGDGKASKPPKDWLPEGVRPIFPLWPVLDELQGSAERARAFLIRFACADLDNRHILDRLPKDLLDRYQRLSNGRLSPIDNLLAVGDLSATKAREAGKRAETLSASAAKGSAGLGLRPTEAELDAAAKAAQAAVGTEAVEAVDRDGLAAEADRLRKVIPQLDAKRAEAQAALDALPALPAADTLKAEVQAAMPKLFRFNIQAVPETCIFCNTTVEPGFFEARLAKYEAATAEKLKAAETRGAARAAAQAEVKKFADALKTGTDRLTEIEAELAAPVQAAVDTDLGEQDAATLQAKYEELVAINAAWSAADATRGQAREAEQESRGWAYLNKEVVALIAAMVETAVQAFNSRVQKHLPKTDVFGLHLTASRVRYGLMTRPADATEGDRSQDYLRTALSGAEWVRVVTAIAAACTPADVTTPVLVPEDRAWSKKALRATMVALGSYPGQVIMTSTIKPSAPVKGWTVVEMK